MNAMRNIMKSSHFWKTWLPPHVLAVMGALHVGWSWSLLILFLVWYALISGLGVAVGLHRYFSHRSFETHPFWEQVMLYFGTLACHGHALFWIALHRGLHHTKSDTPEDPHSPVVHGFWTAYQGYAFDPGLAKVVPIRRASDFLRHPEWQWNVKHYHGFLYLTWGICGALAVLGYPLILVSLALAQVWAIHQEAVVNVMGHTPGFGAYRTFTTTDQSVNRPWLALITWGQSLHNNHHGDAASPNFAHSKHEFDPSMLWVRLIQR